MSRLNSFTLTLSGLALGMGMGAMALAETATEIDSEAPLEVEAGSPGYHAGWPVVSSDGAEVGTVVYAPEAEDDKLRYVVFVREDGNQVQVDESIAILDEHAETFRLRISAAQVDMHSSAPYTVLHLQ